jgi:hypothetical protein
VDRLDRLLAAGVAQAQDQRGLGTYKNLRMSQTMLLERWKLWKFLNHSTKTPPLQLFLFPLEVVV